MKQFTYIFENDTTRGIYTFHINDDKLILDHYREQERENKKDHWRTCVYCERMMPGFNRKQIPMNRKIKTKILKNYLKSLTITI